MALLKTICQNLLMKDDICVVVWSVAVDSVVNNQFEWVALQLLYPVSLVLQNKHRQQKVNSKNNYQLFMNPMSLPLSTVQKLLNIGHTSVTDD